MSTQYDSIVETFLGMNLYNLSMPVLPPADLTLTNATAVRYLVANNGSGSAQENMKFNRLDNPYVRSIGLFSNLADGLVNASASLLHEFNFGLDRFAAALTGTIANAAGNGAVTGAGTLFTKELAVGQYIVWLDDNSVTRVAQISSITDDTNLVLVGVTASTGMFTGATTASAVTPIVFRDIIQLYLSVPTLNQLFLRNDPVSDVSKIRPINGLSTFAGATPVVGASTMAVTGKGTRYLRDVTVGQTVQYGTGANLRTLVVQAVASDTAMTLTVPAAADLEAAFTYPALADTTIGWVDASFGIRFDMVSALQFYTISIDPLYGNGTRRLAFHAVAEIEHSLPVSGTI